MRLKRRQQPIAIPWAILILVLCVSGQTQVQANNGDENAIKDGISATGTEELAISNGVAVDEDDYDEDVVGNEGDEDPEDVEGGNTDHAAVDCSQTEYSQYRECIEARKQNATPTDSGDRTIADYCAQINADCVQKCDGNVSCVRDCPVCPVNADKLAESLVNHRLPANCNEGTATCLANCTTTACRIECFRTGCSNDAGANPNSPRVPSSNSGVHTVIVHQENGTSDGTPTVHRFESKFRAGQNVTTVIKLLNVVNNTNRIETPVNITTSDIGAAANATAPQTNATDVSTPAPEESSPSGGAFGFGYTAQGQCCLAIRPKSCRASTNGLRCHHRRHRTCGPQCTSRTIHVQLRQRCQHHESGCKHGLAYIPQPERPNCVYTELWPFVSCTAAFERQLIENNCHGCYDHYGYGFQQFHENAEHHRIRCRGCYVDAFEIGPLYRRGPVLRPYFYHQAPCYITGHCRGYDWANVDCGRYGCFGDELVDPVWGRQQKRPRGESDFDDDDEDPRKRPPSGRPTTKPPPRQHSSPTTADAAPVNNQTAMPVDPDIHKCKVVSDDGTIEVKNCTDTNLDSNPYAASPANADQLPEKDDNDDDDNEEPYPIEYNDDDNDGTPDDSRCSNLILNYSRLSCKVDGRWY